MYTVADLKKGLKITLDGDPYLVIAFDFTKPGKGQALYRTKMRNMINGTILDRTYRSGETFEPASLEERQMEYLYKEGTHYTFMDQQTYEQVVMEEEAMGDAKNYPARKPQGGCPAVRREGHWRDASQLRQPARHPDGALGQGRYQRQRFKAGHG